MRQRQPTLLGKRAPLTVADPLLTHVLANLLDEHVDLNTVIIAVCCSVVEVELQPECALVAHTADDGGKERRVVRVSKMVGVVVVAEEVCLRVEDVGGGDLDLDILNCSDQLARVDEIVEFGVEVVVDEEGARRLD